MLIGFATIHWTYTSGTDPSLTAEIGGAHPGTQGIKTLLLPNGMRVFCFDLQNAAKVALAWKEDGNDANIHYIRHFGPTGSVDVTSLQGQTTAITYECPTNRHDAALVHYGPSTNRFLTLATAQLGLARGRPALRRTR